MGAGMVQIRVLEAVEGRMSFCLETLEVERLHGPPDLDYYKSKACPTEFPWPPSLRACCTQHNA